jgi:two-component system, OmpR family, response regulator
VETQGLRVLLVEDHAVTADTTAVLLRKYGYVVDIVRTGTKALEVVDADAPDVVLLDLGLPELDGWQVAKQITERWLQTSNGKRPLLVAITGYGQDEDRRRSREAGIDLHLTKPVDPKQLEALLNRFQRIIAD